MIVNNDYLKQCSQPSVFKALIDCAQTGLLPNGRDAAIAPFKGKATFIPMVHGLRKLVHETGVVSFIDSEIIHDKDKVDTRIDSESGRVFKMEMDFFENRGIPIGAVAFAKLHNGDFVYKIMTNQEITKRRNKSPTKTKAIWNEWPDEMAKKTVIKALCDMLPMNSDKLTQALFASIGVDPNDKGAALEKLKKGAMSETLEKKAKEEQGDVVDASYTVIDEEDKK